ncbi:hypothetical protein AB0K18_48190 [Nonomuraea sp. NPDC049421]|uniref:hypothetical protein n=1 Tax=Nonomuraea sp. NPDC049421 TaxID=3155275 RepID=UPI003415D5F5
MHPGKVVTVILEEPQLRVLFAGGLLSVTAHRLQGGVCPVTGLWPTFGGDGTWLAEQDGVAKVSEPGAAVHLPFEELGLGIDAFGTAVVEWRA